LENAVVALRSRECIRDVNINSVQSLQ